jgi:hypothetical protein
MPEFLVDLPKLSLITAYEKKKTEYTTKLNKDIIVEKLKEFDQKIIGFLRKKKVKEIINMDSKLIEEAGECGYRSILILLGILDNTDWEPEILSYQAPFGVGYLTANFKLNELLH